MQILRARPDDAAMLTAIAFAAKRHWGHPTTLTELEGQRRELPVLVYDFDARCIFGTNVWMIEGEFTRNSKDTWWCTGTNIIWHSFITKELPESDRKRPTFIAGDVPHV